MTDSDSIYCRTIICYLTVSIPACPEDVSSPVRHAVRKLTTGICIWTVVVASNSHWKPWERGIFETEITCQFWGAILFWLDGKKCHYIPICTIMNLESPHMVKVRFQKMVKDRINVHRVTCSVHNDRSTGHMLGWDGALQHGQVFNHALSLVKSTAHWASWDNIVFVDDSHEHMITGGNRHANKKIANLRFHSILHTTTIGLRIRALGKNP